MSQPHHRHQTRTAGFTLAELLVVIAIIGILVGLLVPAVFSAVSYARQATVKMEVDGLAQAIEMYRSKYGEYPPDGSDPQLLIRHLRKAFPQILDSEIAVLNQQANAGRSMSGAEALVFFLGGFSDNPQQPFTGPGGPFVQVPNSNSFQYNTRRNNALFDFNLERLTLTVQANMQVSNDEILYGLGGANLIPVYRSRFTEAPYVYFDARRYGVQNRFMFNNPEIEAQDCAMPYPSDRPDTQNPAVPYEWMEPQKFQIVSPGLSGVFGCDPSGGVVSRFPSGRSIDDSFKNFQNGLPLKKAYQLDNVTNFSGARLDYGAEE
jgi:prepilin-type N-terminal cleavage/methylation domain-containing protein